MASDETARVRELTLALRLAASELHDASVLLDQAGMARSASDLHEAARRASTAALESPRPNEKS